MNCLEVCSHDWGEEHLDGNILLNWSNSEGYCIGDVGSGLEVVFGRPVGLLGCDVLLDLSLVDEPVFSKGLNESGWLLEDLGPLLDGSDVVTDVLAWGNVFLEVEEELLEVLEGGDDLEAFEV